MTEKKRFKDNGTKAVTNKQRRATSPQMTAEEPASGEGRGGKEVSQGFTLLMVIGSFNIKHISFTKSKAGPSLRTTDF